MMPRASEESAEDVPSSSTNDGVTPEGDVERKVPDEGPLAPTSPPFTPPNASDGAPREDIIEL